MEGKFNQLNNNTYEVATRLQESQNLVKLLYYTDDNPLDGENIIDTGSLLLKNIFPAPFIEEIQTEQKCYINFIFDNIVFDNVAYKNLKINFDIICHNGLWMINGGIRPYLIMNEVDKLFNNQRIMGVGKLKFNSSRWFPVNNSYQGYHMVYEFSDFN